jgi:hypothetical protein
VAAVHGYVEARGLEVRGDFDGRKHFDPETIFRPSKFEIYLLAHDRAVGEGRAPPFNASPRRALSPAEAREERGRQVVRKLNEEDHLASGERPRAAPRDVTPDVRRLRSGDH